VSCASRPAVILTRTTSIVLPPAISRFAAADRLSSLTRAQHGARNHYTSKQAAAPCSAIFRVIFTATFIIVGRKSRGEHIFLIALVHCR